MSGGLWYVAVFSLAIGAFMVVMSVLLLVTGRVPELSESRSNQWWDPVAHALTASATGLLLVAGGIGVLVDHQARWSMLLSAFGLGALAYSLALAPGEELDRGDRAMLTLLAILWVLTLVAIILRFAA